MNDFYTIKDKDWTKGRYNYHETDALEAHGKSLSNMKKLGFHLGSQARRVSKLPVHSSPCSSIKKDAGGVEKYQLNLMSE